MCPGVFIPSSCLPGTEFLICAEGQIKARSTLKEGVANFLWVLRHSTTNGFYSQKLRQGIVLHTCSPNGGLLGKPGLHSKTHSHKTKLPQRASPMVQETRLLSLRCGPLALCSREPRSTPPPPLLGCSVNLGEFWIARSNAPPVPPLLVAFSPCVCVQALLM